MKALSIEEQPLPTVAVKQPKVDVVKEYGQTKRKPHVNFVVVGHVDAGKSTLMGRLMVDIGAIDERTINKYKHDADKLGKGSFAFAWVLDQSEEERERGVTIDVATNYFESPKVSFTILDAPGHKDFVPNMIAGASEADFAVLVIDSSPNAFESGFNQNGQTKEHALLVRSLGVQRIIVAVNKLDNVRWAEYRFAEIKEQMQAFLTSIGFAESQASFVPCSGLAGDNIVRRSTEEELLAWYGDGPTLLDELENLRLVERDIKGSLRVSVTDVFKSSSSSLVNVTGRINSGNVQSGETVVVVPSMQTATVKTIMVSNDLRDWAVAGDNVQLGLSSIDLVHLRAGDVLCGLTSAPVRRARTFTARVILFQLRVPIIKGSNAIVYRGRSSQAVKITKLIAVLDKASGKVSKSKPRHLVSGQSAVVEIEVEGKGCFPLETFRESKDLGRVVLRQDGNTIAAGIVEEVGAVLNEL
ncbi:P-loop containing nucleoside triphosphate hydrolase protein [Myxozyma melibiosi]|uniref:P-loop containing nucleoside triphosphate hydrolase protein n=1 Tax=Myxozyma melibiosi TaxID=54550 RepID=A0ABR1F0E8_9ASCO